MQESEDELENMRYQKKLKEQIFTKEIAELEARDALDKKRTTESIAERDALLELHDEAECQKIDDHTML